MSYDGLVYGLLLKWYLRLSLVKQKNGEKDNILWTNKKSNIKIVERKKIDNPNTQIHDRPQCLLCTCSAITKSSVVKLVIAKSSVVKLDIAKSSVVKTRYSKK